MAGLTPSKHGPTSRTLRVLVADDVDGNRLILKLFVERFGHSATEVGDGAKAVAAVAAGETDLVLMDVEMPVMDGIEALAAIRALPGPDAQVPVVAVTAHVGRELDQRIASADFDALLTKPLAMDEVERLLTAAAQGGAIGSPLPGNRPDQLPDQLPGRLSR